MKKKISELNKTGYKISKFDKSEATLTRKKEDTNY